MTTQQKCDTLYNTSNRTLLRFNLNDLSLEIKELLKTNGSLLSVKNKIQLCSAITLLRSVSLDQYKIIKEINKLKNNVQGGE